MKLRYAMRGFEACVTTDGTESLTANGGGIRHREFEMALERVIANAGTPGIDKMTVHQQTGKEFELNF